MCRLGHRALSRTCLTCECGSVGTCPCTVCLTLLFRAASWTSHRNAIRVDQANHPNGGSDSDNDFNRDDDGSGREQYAALPRHRDMRHILAASKLSGLHAFVSGLPHEYDTVLGPCGVPVGWSQRLSIALARVALHNPPLLVVDHFRGAYAATSTAPASLGKQRTGWLGAGSNAVAPAPASAPPPASSPAAAEETPASSKGPEAKEQASGTPAPRTPPRTSSRTRRTQRCVQVRR